MHTRSASPGFRLSFFASLLMIIACGRDDTTTSPVQERKSALDAHIQTFIYLVPVSDVSNPGALEPLNNLYAQVDESVANDDVDYIWKNRLGWPFTLSHGTVRLSWPIGGQPSPSQVHTIKLRWKVIGNYQTPYTHLEWRLMQLSGAGNTMVYQGSCPASSTYVTCSASFPGNVITDYTNLGIELGVALAPATSGDQIQGRVTWARLEIN